VFRSASFLTLCHFYNAQPSHHSNEKNTKTIPFRSTAYLREHNDRRRKHHTQRQQYLWEHRYLRGGISVDEMVGTDNTSTNTGGGGGGGGGGGSGGGGAGGGGEHVNADGNLVVCDIDVDGGQNEFGEDSIFSSRMDGAKLHATHLRNFHALRSGVVPRDAAATLASANLHAAQDGAATLSVVRSRGLIIPVCYAISVFL
jgi:hypothetical protein